jgi:hypothetical protein
LDGDRAFRPLDPASTVVVPVRPGPAVPLSSLDRERDELDDALDDVFGEPDGAGAGPFDAVLLLGGAAAIIAGLTALVPAWVIVVGIIAFALGSVLPLRTFWRRRAGARRAARQQRAIGDGVVVRIDHPAVVDLLAAHQRCLDAAAGLAAWRRVQVDAVAHAALLEAATLLDGHPPLTPAEVDYVEARVAALRRLADAVTDPAVGDGDPDGLARQARADARVEVERAAGSAVDDADALVRALRGPA